MIKRIHKSELRLGMYIHSLDCNWMLHSFIRGSFPLQRQTDLEQILDSAVENVQIDTTRGLDTEVPAPRDPAPQGPTAHLEELPIARQIKREADTIIHSLLLDVRMGRQIQVERLEPVVSRIIGSILRNPGTLVSLCRLRQADQATFQHSVSSCALLIMFGQHLHLDRDTLHEAGVAGMLHDIGKMRVPDHILNKPGPLTQAESAIMRGHVRLGLETLSQTPGISKLVMQVAGEHHERLDGSGYPRRLRGLEISPMGRMATIVDVYDAMTSIRIYQGGIEPAEALRRLYLESPAGLDGDLVQHFIQAIGIYPVGSLVRLESGRLAVVLQQNQGGPLHPVVRVLYDIRHAMTLPPFDLDLAGGGDGVAGHEEPAAWNLVPGSLIDPGPMRQARSAAPRPAPG